MGHFPPTVAIFPMMADKVSKDRLVVGVVGQIATSNKKERPPRRVAQLFTHPEDGW